MKSSEQKLRVRKQHTCRRDDQNKFADFETVLGHSKQLFFPCDISKKGFKLDDCTFDLRDFSHSTLPREFTVGEIYRQEKHSGILRFYVITMAAQDLSALLPNSHVVMAEVGSKKRKRNAFDISNAFPELYLCNTVEIPETILEVQRMVRVLTSGHKCLLSLSTIH